MSNVSLLLLALSWVWLFLFDRADTCALLAHNRIYALSLAATLWLLALTLIVGPPLLLALLTLPCVPVFVIAVWQSTKRVWQALRRVWTAWQALGLFTRNRKAA